LIPLETQQVEQRRAVAIAVGFVLGMSIVFGLIALYFRFDFQGIRFHDVVPFTLTLILPCAALWLRAHALCSLRIELDDDRITRTELLPLRHTTQRISFLREDIAHIREIPKQGLMVRGPNSKGRYIDLEIPRSLQDYDDLRSRLAAWHPIRESWL